MERTSIEKPRKTVLPERTTKTTQKLVLFPDEHYSNEELHNDHGLEYALDPKTLPERLMKEQRRGLSRVTSIYVADGFNLDRVIDYLKDYHVVHTNKYDECLYFFYEPSTKERVFGFSTVGSPQLHLNTQLSDEIVDHAQMDSITSMMNRSEVFLFDYGIIVMWNFTQMEEIVLVEKMRKFAIGFDDSYEVIPEEFHFQYELSTSKQARIFNDMITLKSSSPLMKLTISHGLAQSVKLSIYENIIDETIQGTIPISKMMAKYGKVKMSRSKIMKIVGQLYRLKMNVNLVSNVLDKPEFFWSEPRLEPLYIAVRSYLEIPQRVELLNKRADVLTDLLEMLTDHMNSNEMTYITWIVIILVFLAAVTALSEVGVKLLRLQAGLN